MVDREMLDMMVTKEFGESVIKYYNDLDDYEGDSLYHRQSFWFRDGDRLIGIDCTYGDCFVEEFDNLADLVKWLDGEDIDFDGDEN